MGWRGTGTRKKARGRLEEEGSCLKKKIEGESNKEEQDSKPRGHSNVRQKLFNYSSQFA